MAHLWVRVKDRGTGHEFDVPEGDPRIGSLLDLVKADRYPPAYQPRPPKHLVDIAGQSVARVEAPRPAAPRQPTKKETRP
jgi:hypothetical protein